MEQIAILEMGLFLFILILGAIGWFVGKAASNGNGSEWRCPHGYDEYACNKGCPLHDHCVGCGDEHFLPRWTERHGTDTTYPASGNEDGDWRTVFMDDERYDEREEDEMHDDDREENGW